jgi:hypothetical protein
MIVLAENAGQATPSVDHNKLGFGGCRPGNRFGKSNSEPPETQ